MLTRKELETLLTDGRARMLQVRPWMAYASIVVAAAAGFALGALTT